jgi:hypothetical protein
MNPPRFYPVEHAKIFDLETSFNIPGYVTVDLTGKRAAVVMIDGRLAGVIKVDKEPAE